MKLQPLLWECRGRLHCGITATDLRKARCERASTSAFPQPPTAWWCASEKRLHVSPAPCVLQTCREEHDARCSQPAERSCAESGTRAACLPSSLQLRGRGGGLNPLFFFYCIVRCRAAAGRHTAARCSPSSHNTFASACLCDVMCRSPLACPGHP